MSKLFKWASLAVLGICLVIVFATGTAVWPQASTINFTVAGQSMIRSDFRAHAPDEVATISPLLTGDVKFANFEATVIEKESTHDGGLHNRSRRSNKAESSEVAQRFDEVLDDPVWAGGLQIIGGRAMLPDRVTDGLKRVGLQAGLAE